MKINDGEAVEDDPVSAEMNWPEAQYALIEGQRLTRREWNDPGEVIFLADSRLKIRKASGSLHDLIVSDGDMLATDWIVAREN